MTDRAKRMKPADNIDSHRVSKDLDCIGQVSTTPTANINNTIF